MKEYDHYIGLDWAQANMAIARMTKKSDKLNVIDIPSDISDLKEYLKSLKGTKILTFEETTTAQWLYTELSELVDEIVICDPYRNKLLSEGPKDDKIDARKLVQLLRFNLLKPVFHTADQFICLRKLVSGYEDCVKAYVRAVNQRASLFRAVGRNSKKDSVDSLSESFVIEGLDSLIEQLKKDRTRYEHKFSSLVKTYRMISNLDSIPGIGDIFAVKIAARIVNIERFKNVKHFWSYCGLLKFDKMSGGKSYGKRKPRYCRSMKNVISSAVLTVIAEGSNNPFRNRYLYLKTDKRYSDDMAVSAVRRFYASVIYGVMKSKKKFNLKKVVYVNKKN